MKPRLLIIITGDPRKSSRPAEALRIAAGVGVWQKVDVTIYLRGDAIQMLGEPAALVDEDDYAGYRSMLAESGQPIFVQKDAAEIEKLEKDAKTFAELSDDHLAELVSGQTYVLRI